MADLLQGRSVEEIEKYLENIWIMSFRALDDIKESVRTAAFKTCRALTLMTVKYCDPKHVTAAEGQRVLDIIIPFLVGKGLLSNAEEVSKFSLTTILKICKQAGSLLRSHIPVIVVALLEGLTSMEPQMMSTLLPSRVRILLMRRFLHKLATHHVVFLFHPCGRLPEFSHGKVPGFSGAAGE